MFWTNFTIKKVFVQFFINNSMRICMKKRVFWIFSAIFTGRTPNTAAFEDEFRKISFHSDLNVKVSTGIQDEDRQREWHIMTSRIEPVGVFGL
jgi:hypothetical protein